MHTILCVMIHHNFYDFLSSRSAQPLPGKHAQEKMLPQPLADSYRFPDESSGSANPSSVLIPIFSDHSENLSVILTLRTEHIRHAGQISFPGGRSEVNESLVDTALRETHEEIGLEPHSLRIACSITPLYLHRGNNRITPFVGFLDGEPELTLNPNEVQEAFTVPLERLMQDEFIVRETWDLNDRRVDVPYWKVHPQIPLWGATAMILSELVELYKEFLNKTGQ